MQAKDKEEKKEKKKKEKKEEAAAPPAEEAPAPAAADEPEPEPEATCDAPKRKFTGNVFALFKQPQIQEFKEVGKDGPIPPHTTFRILLKAMATITLCVTYNNVGIINN